MRKNIIIATIAIVGIAGAGFLLLGNEGGGGGGAVVVSECSEICATAHESCPSLIDVGTCESKCDRMSEETKEHLSTADSCEKLTARPDLLSEVLVPEVGDASEYEEKAGASQDCEAACGNYVSACLTLVPNATEALFNDGYESCLSECSGWDADKTECMITAFDCEAMTNVCGL